MEAQFGKKAKDKITGFTGIVTGHCKYISGCNQTLLVPTVGEDGKYNDSHWFDDQRIEYLEDDAVIVLDNTATPGADKPAPKR